MRRKLFPFQVCVFALVTEEATGTTVAGGLSFLAFDTLSVSWSGHFCEDVLDVEEVVNEECSLQAGDSFLGQGGGLATVGTFHHLSLWGLACQWLQALLTEDMEALEQLGVCVVI